MADDVKKSDVRKRVPFFSTPLGQVSAALLLWIASCVLAAAAVLLLRRMAFDDAQTRILLTYAAFGPSTLLLVLSAVFLIVGSVRWALFGRSAPPSTNLSQNREITLLESINQRLLLSETAKKISYRSEDMTMLRQTIRDDIRMGEFDAAMVLVAALASTYGQLEEAEAFREEISQARTKEQEAKVAAGISQLEDRLADHDFAAALKEAARLQRLYPDSPAVADLPRRVGIAKEQYKRELERAFLQANEREEVDRALDLMKLLDHLLTPEEAEPYREVARGVIGKKRDNLGVQFKMAVHDREWAQAVVAGEQIIKQFPNTRMADEVRQRIDQLRANAGSPQAAAEVTPVAPITTVRPTQPTGQTGISFTHTE